tara:strand:+ start:464 stop:1507 length:1044 start_codon:yes stop_codon:yes gene_type:complete
MGYLDNSGDIILDAVLTDAGRARLAKGDGSFRIVKFALGDDEIDYSLYQVNANTGYEDLRILKLPIFEAFTNNTSTLNSKLLTYSNNTSLLYLPVIFPLDSVGNGLSSINSGYFAAVNDATYALMDPIAGAETATDEVKRTAGILKTQNAGNPNNIIAYDQGLDNAASLDWLGNTQPDLVEQQYIIEVDDRLLQITTPVGGQVASPSFVDDDSIASYFFSLSNTPDYFAAQAGGPQVSNGALAGGNEAPVSFIVNNGINSINGRKAIGEGNSTGLLGTRLVFGLATTSAVATQAVTEGLWSSLGTQESITFDGADFNTYAAINTVVRITGVTTGYRTDIPVKVLKDV